MSSIQVACLGLDCGGTKTRWLWSPDGVRAGGVTSGVQPAALGVEVAAAALVAALHRAAPALDATAAVCAVAGAGDASVRAQLCSAVERVVPFPVAIVGDVLAAAAGALAAGPGLLVWSGTGSFAVALAPDGELHRTGGRGHLLGDQGSAYDLVRRAAAAVVLAADDLGPATALTTTLCSRFGAASPQHLGAVLQRLPSAEVAAALPQVLSAAAAGDLVADSVLDDGIAALALVAAAAVRAAGLSWVSLPVVFGGGVLQGSDALRHRLQARLSSLGAGPATLADDDAAARGAAALAAAFHHRQPPLCRWVDDGAL